jgi:hypothetical protein
MISLRDMMGALGLWRRLQCELMATDWPPELLLAIGCPSVHETLVQPQSSAGACLQVSRVAIIELK